MGVYPLDVAPAPRGALAGVGVIVTRPARQAAGLARALAALGATPIVFPAIAILPPVDRTELGRVHARLHQFDIAIFVSANAVEYGVPAPDAWPATIATFAPGPGTADALAATGIAGVRIPSTTFDSEGLLALPELSAVGGKRILIFRGEGGRGHLGDALLERGATVTYVGCYRRAVPETGAAGLAQVLREGRAQALTLTSSEGLGNLCALLGGDDRLLLQRLPAFAPHPRIAEHARTLGFTAIETGGADAGLIQGLLQWFDQHPAGR